MLTLVSTDLDELPPDLGTLMPGLVELNLCRFGGGGGGEGRLHMGGCADVYSLYWYHRDDLSKGHERVWWGIRAEARRTRGHTACVLSCPSPFLPLVP